MVLDLFAGSGQLGIEALSRGAKFAVFVDALREAQEVIRANFQSTGWRRSPGLPLWTPSGFKVHRRPVFHRPSGPAPSRVFWMKPCPYWPARWRKTASSSARARKNEAFPQKAGGF